jgi:hypothetical protein
MGQKIVPAREGQAIVVVKAPPCEPSHGRGSLFVRLFPRKEHPMRRLLDLLVWTAVIAVTIGVISFATQSPKLYAEPIPGDMSGPSVVDVARALGEDPALCIE